MQKVGEVSLLELGLDKNGPPLDSIAQVDLKQLLDSAAVAKYLARIFFPEPKRGNGVLLGGEANIANSVFAADFWVGMPPGTVTTGLFMVRSWLR